VKDDLDSTPLLEKFKEKIGKADKEVPSHRKAKKVNPELKVKLFKEEAKLPTRGTDQAAGLDLYACESATIHSGRFFAISTGIQIEIPEGHFGMLVPRSGLAFKHQVSVVNSPGIIDSDYRGEVKVLLENRGQDLFRVNLGDRIAQLVIVPYAQFNPIAVDSLTDTSRAEGGFGSTGK
jgi:dUTP pyrophosphatase